MRRRGRVRRGIFRRLPDHVPRGFGTKTCRNSGNYYRPASTTGCGAISGKRVAGNSSHWPKPKHVVIRLCRSEPGCRYIAAIDYAEKRDYTVGVVVHRAGQRVVVDRMDVVRPQPDAPVEVAWVEEWIERIAADFHAVTFVVDEYQLVSTIQKYGRRFDVRRFEFLSGRGNHALALNLRQLILQRQVRWYAGCGELHAEWGRDDLETELASVVLRQSASGRCRIDHHVGGRQHDDRAFALGAACLHAVEGASGEEWLLVGSM